MRHRAEGSTWVIIFLLILAVVLTIMLAAVFLHPDKFSSSRISPDVPIVNLDEQDEFLHAEEIVVVETTSTSTGSTTTEVLPLDRVLFEYVEVIDGCGPHFQGECLNARSGPGTDHVAVAKLRNGMVLKVGGKVERTYSKRVGTSTIMATTTETWYKVVFDEWLRYPERVKADWYVHADYVSILKDEGDKTSWEHGNASTTKKIVVDRSEQKLYAYEDGELFMEAAISTGLALTPTPRGVFTIFKKTPSRYMQGPLPNLADRQYYDLPGVPWNLYFTDGGAVIHGAYWHDSFGSRYSHGCVNLPPNTAREIYNWAELGTTVVVQD